jgi:uncharacterized cofD-like protein
MPHQVVTIGGGSGSPIINESLLRTNKVDGLVAVAAVYDTGGATGRRRLDAYGQELAYSDAMRILLSLVSPDNINFQAFQTVKELFNHRDGRDRVLGQDIFSRFFSPTDGFIKIEQHLTALGINLKGRVLPSSTQPTNITFVTSSGRTFTGEHLFDDQRMSKDTILDMYLNPPVRAYGPAADAIAQAKLIILSCGSLYGSVLANFLPQGMKAALSQSPAKMFYITNLTSTRNETHNFTPGDFVNIIKKYTGKPPDGLIVPQISRPEFEKAHPDIARLYDLEHSHFLGWSPPELHAVEAAGVRIITHQATTVVKGKNNYRVIRHDPRKLSVALQKILPL